MSLDAEVSKLKQCGRIVVDFREGITMSGFEGENCTCRDVVALGLAHAIRWLSDELRLTIEEPGANHVAVMD